MIRQPRNLSLFSKFDSAVVNDTMIGFDGLMGLFQSKWLHNSWSISCEGSTSQKYYFQGLKRTQVLGACCVASQIMLISQYWISIPMLYQGVGMNFHLLQRFLITSILSRSGSLKSRSVKKFLLYSLPTGTTSEGNDSNQKVLCSHKKTTYIQMRK